MKKFLAILFSAACITAFSLPGYADQWSFSEPDAKKTDTPDSGNKPFASILSLSSDGSLKAFSGAGFAPFVPMQLDQFVISLLDTSADDKVTESGGERTTARFQLDTGIKKKSYLTDPKSLLMDELLGSSSNSYNISSSVIFVGVGLDLESGYLKGNVYVGRPLETLSNKLYNTNKPDRTQHQGVDTDAQGFEASAGYQLSNMFALGAGIGKMIDKNKETDQTEEVYAIYAQAVLAVAPGVQVKPEVGQVERIKEAPETKAEDVDESFYAGAVWEINF